MKKLISLLLALVMVFALVACAAKETPAANDAPAKSDASTETPAEAPAESTDDKTAEDTASSGKSYRIGVFFKDSSSMFWRYVGQRDYVAIVQAVVVATLFVPAFNAIFHPVSVPSGRGDTTLSVPTGVVVTFFLLALVFVGGSRFIARTA